MLSSIDSFAPESLSSLNAEQLRKLARDLIAKVARQDAQITQRDQKIASLDQAISSKDREILYRQAKIDQLTHEMAVLKRWKFGRSRKQLDAAQASLLDETIDADIAAIEQELEDLASAAKADTESRKQPKRAALPAELPCVDMPRAQPGIDLYWVQ
ncbi:Mobile element protein [Polaromonas sp. CG9_12]|nr:Mobile element protein [Polaromonas sp. CG9_12]